MVIHKLDSENEEQFIWRIGQAKDAGEIDMSWEELADILNMELGNDDRPLSEAAFRKPYSYAKKYYDAGCFDKKENTKQTAEETAKQLQEQYGVDTSINKDGTVTSNRLLIMNQEQTKNPEYILKAHGFDVGRWQLVSARNNIRQVISKQDGIVTLYASFITVKPITSYELSLEQIDDFFKKLDRNYSLPKLEIDDNAYLNGNKMLLIDIADLHMNLQASLFTTGNEYNCELAEKAFFHVINDILSRTNSYCFDEIIFCIGGDMLNGDGLSGATTKGTPQTSDIHYYDACERLYAMTVKAIDLLKDICPVRVIYVMGNHDEVTGYKLAKYIDAWFRSEEKVSVDYKPLPRKYELYGKTLLCFAHDGKVQKLPAIIADEARTLWSQADTVEVFLQHLHTEQVLMEDNNIRIQRLPTISARSKWSSDKGYGSKRQCKSFIFDKDDGLTDVLYTPIKQTMF